MNSQEKYSKLKDTVLKYIDKFGLKDVMDIMGLSFTKIFSIGIGAEYFTRKIKQEFIQNFFKSLGYGVDIGFNLL